MDSANDRLLDMLSTAIGSHIRQYLTDPTVIEIMLNPDGRLWIDRLGQGMADTGHTVAPEAAERVIRLISGATKTVCNEKNPLVSAELAMDGSRFQGMLPPTVKNPTFSIRKRAIAVFTLADYVQQGGLTAYGKDLLAQAVREKKNILIVGGTGSGKTTLANALLAEIAKLHERIVIIEDTQELQCVAPNKVFMRSNDTVSMNDLLKCTMRMRPDRIVVGEVRGGEALTLLKSWNTGHPGGCATVHANSAKGGLYRLEQLIQEAIPNPPHTLIAEAVHIIVYIERTGKGRMVKEIAAVEGYQNDYILKILEGGI